jgi:flagellar biosynthesis/type III secretory pathway protein FliH
MGPSAAGRSGGPGGQLPERHQEETEALREEARAEAAGSEPSDGRGGEHEGEGRAEGWQLGFAEGKQEAEATCVAQVESLRTLVASAAKEREETLRAVEREIAALTLAAAAHIVRDQAKLDEMMVERTILAALKWWHRVVREGTRQPSDLAR